MASTVYILSVEPKKQSKGIYRYNILGSFSTQEKAEEAAAAHIAWTAIRDGKVSNYTNSWGEISSETDWYEITKSRIR